MPFQEDAALQAVQPDHSKKIGLRDFILIPLGCLIRTPLLLVFVGLAVIGSWVAYTSFNWDFFGIAAPPYREWDISPGFLEVSSPEGKSWVITYESQRETTYVGLVRHVTPIREGQFPLLSHDILVTQGNYTDPKLVGTSVSNHHFSWHAYESIDILGTINLLHTVPENEEIYRTLLQVHKGDKVRVTGREIKSIVYYPQKGQKYSTWADTGCNTLLVTKVEITRIGEE